MDFFRIRSPFDWRDGEVRTYFEDDKKELLKVEYTFGFIKISPDQLRINLHHSSLPYND